jgi:hypothetical protein
VCTDEFRLYELSKYQSTNVPCEFQATHSMSKESSGNGPLCIPWNTRVIDKFFKLSETIARFNDFCDISIVVLSFSTNAEWLQNTWTSLIIIDLTWPSRMWFREEFSFRGKSIVPSELCRATTRWAFYWQPPEDFIFSKCISFANAITKLSYPQWADEPLNLIA